MTSGERTLAVLGALIMTAWAGGCSTRSEAAVRATRALGEATAGSLHVTLRLEQRVVSVSAGLRGAGRGAGWFDAHEECRLALVVEARAGDAELTRDHVLDAGRLLYEDVPTCAARFETITVETCADAQHVVVLAGGRARALASYGDRVWDIDRGAASSCAEALQAVPSTPLLVAGAHVSGACEQLLVGPDTREATRCMLDHQAWVDGQSFTPDGEAAAIGRALSGESRGILYIDWLADVGRGTSVSPDREEALYESLLHPWPDGAWFQVAIGRASWALTLAPSDERRRAFVTAGIALCRDSRLSPFQRQAVVTAADVLADGALSTEARAACGTEGYPAIPARLRPTPP
ncbi:MAG: hypothetical protein H6726_30310 [Sandaracinaceae bacterium]|nr:hypothetical protein [Sandaracinaceae bacterium]